MTRTLVLFFATIIALAVLSTLLVYTSELSDKTPLTPRTLQSSTPSISTPNPSNSTTRILATGLDTPWSLAFLPDKSLLVTERKGTLRLINNKGKLLTNPIATIKDVIESGEGGLLGVTIHPKFSSNHYIYLYYTYENTNNDTRNKVVRYKLQNNKLSDEKVITDKIPSSVFHNGGRIKFGPDGYLYITTGDAETPSLSQTRTSLAGKILRVTEDGDNAPGNPFGTRVYSYGHRNPQGITWDSKGNLWETEHGNNSTDELNKIEPGKNYGWPTITGDEKRSGMISPVIQSGTTTTWDPGDIAYYNNALYFGALKGTGLFRVQIINGQLTTPKKYFSGKFGRIRDVVLGPDNMLYITTSNKDGRGNPAPLDDKVIIVNPANL